MRFICCVLFPLLGSFSSNAQSTSDVGKIALSVVMPENIENLDGAQFSKIESKITRIITASGLAATGYNHNFIIYPKFDIYESEVVEGGLQNITVVKGELSLSIMQIDNNLLFSTVTISLKGSGSSRSAAITNAISQVPPTNPQFEQFIQTGKSKIINYYESKCEDIVKKSESYTKMQKYDQALALLMTVPEEVSGCYAKIQDKAIDAFKAFKRQQCSELIQRATTTLAGNNYMGTLQILADIDPSTECFNEAQRLAVIAEKKANAEAKKEWDFRMEQYHDALSLEKQRMEAIKEIAITYYKSQPKTIVVNKLIIR